MALRASGPPAGTRDLDSLVQRPEVLEESQGLGVKCEVRNCLSSHLEGTMSRHGDACL